MKNTLVLLLMMFGTLMFSQTCVVTGDTITYVKDLKEVGTLYMEHAVVMKFSPDKDSILSFLFLTESFTSGECIVLWSLTTYKGVAVYHCRDETDTAYRIEINSKSDQLLLRDYTSKDMIIFKNPTEVKWYE